MATMSERARRLNERLRGSKIEATWSTPDDLARRARESVADVDLPGRVFPSAGQIHLTGEGVTSHSSHMDEVGSVMVAFQRAVAAFGAAQEGHKALRGKLPDVLIAKTRLDLITSPTPGSVVLDFMPATRPEGELGDAAPLFGEKRRQRVDEAVDALLGVLADGSGVEPDADTFVEELSVFGPRAATALRSLAEILSNAEYETRMTWEEPERPTRRVEVSASAAAHIASLIEGRDLDHSEDVLDGILRTISSQSRWVIQLADGETVSVKRGALSEEEIHSVHVDEHVKLVVDAVERSTPGGETKFEYTAKRIERLSES